MRKITIAAIAAIVLVTSVEASQSTEGNMTIVDQQGLVNRLHSLEASILKENPYRNTVEYPQDVTFYCKKLEETMIASSGQFDQLAQSQQTKGGRVSELTLSWGALCIAGQKNYSDDTYSKEIKLDVILWAISYRVAKEEVLFRKKAKDVKELGGTPELTQPLWKRISDSLPPVIKPYSEVGNSRRYVPPCPSEYNKISKCTLEYNKRPDYGTCMLLPNSSIKYVNGGVINAAIESNEVWVIDTFSTRPVEFVKFCKSNSRIVAIHDSMKKMLADKVEEEAQ